MSKYEYGFTMVETVVVLAITGLLTATLIVGSGSSTKSQNFSGKIRQFTQSIKNAQTKGYTIQSGVCNAAAQVAVPGGGNGCYWRGNVLEFDTTSSAYYMQLIFGQDVSQFGLNNDQRAGLGGVQSFNQFALGNDGITLSAIDQYDAATNSYISIAAVSLAFLAPDGKSYDCVGAASTCRPSPSNVSPYLGQDKIRFTITDTASAYTATVLFDSANGTITSQVN